jgi:hypothetical protein
MNYVLRLTLNSVTVCVRVFPMKCLTCNIKSRMIAVPPKMRQDMSHGPTKIVTKKCICISIYIKMCLFVRNLKSPKVMHRFRCNFDTTLHSITSVFLYIYYI